MLQVNKITIEYEGGAKVVIDKSAHGIIKWLHDITHARRHDGNNLDDAMVKVGARVILPQGERPFRATDSLV